MVVGAKVCDLTEDLLWFVCGVYVGILTSPLSVLLGGIGHTLSLMTYTTVKIHHREPQTASGRCWSAVSAVSAACHKKSILPSVSGVGLL